MSPAAGFLGRLLTRPIAHRGLWRTGGPPENSLAAFEAACARGYGVELDVRLTADGEAVVYHDETLDRLTAQSGLVEERTARDLTALVLLGSGQAIPTLAQALAVIGGRTPLLVELKTPPGQEGLLEARVAGLLAAYGSPAGVLSFNAAALAWLAGHAPALPRGLNAQTPRQLAAVPQARPAFLSVSRGLAGDRQVRAWRDKDGVAIAWTARSAADAARLAGLVDNIIFEGFEP